MTQAAIDLRSDTVTRPTAAMLQAMRDASFGDDSRDGDPTVRRLEALAADKVGKEAAVFMPSGTMTNLVAVLTHMTRGGAVLLDAGSHMLNSELGGIAAIAGAFPRTVRSLRGAMNLEALASALRQLSRNSAGGAALVCMETSHNAAGGAVLPPEHMQAVYALAGERGIPVHIDGARIFNAATALRTSARKLAASCDSIGFCISKGLSAPVGSLLCGPQAFVERARGFRRMVGGNMRQAGPLAAAGIVALETMVDRLQEDHALARKLALGIHAIDKTLVRIEDVETNLVRVELPQRGPTARDWCAALDAHGVRVSPCDAYALRFVTHRHVCAEDIDRVLHTFAHVWNGFVRGEYLES